MRVVHLNAQDRARRKVLIASQSALKVPNRNRELVDDQITTSTHRDQRAPIPNDFANRIQPRFPDSTTILFTNRLEVIAAENVPGLLIWENYRVKLLSQLAGFDVLVVNRLVWKIVLFETPHRLSLNTFP